jgi:hypothetical protein
MWRVWVIGSLLAGCDAFFGGAADDEPPQTPDASAPDAGPDSPGPTFEATRIIVYSTDGSVPLPGTLVHFVAPDQTTIKEVVTDQEGIASASTPPNSTAIVFQKDESQLGPLVKIFGGTTPGDTIISGRRRRQDFPVLGNVTFQLSSFPNAAGYRVNVSCASPTGFSTTPFVTVQVLECPQINGASAIGWAVDSAGVAISGPAVIPGLNLGGAVGSTVQFSGYREFDVMTLSPSFTNIPVTATDVRWAERLFLDVNTLASEFEVPLPASPQTVFSSVHWSIGTLRYLPAGGFGEVRVDLVQDSGATAFPFDAATMIRGIKNGHYAAATNTIVWEEEAGGVPGVMMHARISLTNTNRRLQIQLHAPYDPSRSIALPPLPDEVALHPGESVIVDLTAQTIADHTYTEMLFTTDTSHAFTPVFWEPSFEGTVFEARD